MMKLTKENLTIYAAQHYHNPRCIDSEEFFEDLKKFKYIKRLLNRYRDTDILSERLILNHLIVIFNVFGYYGGLKILGLEYTNIEMDVNVVEALRKIAQE